MLLLSKKTILGKRQPEIDVEESVSGGLDPLLVVTRSGKTIRLVKYGLLSMIGKAVNNPSWSR